MGKAQEVGGVGREEIVGIARVGTGRTTEGGELIGLGVSNMGGEFLKMNGVGLKLDGDRIKIGGDREPDSWVLTVLKDEDE